MNCCLQMAGYLEIQRKTDDSVSRQSIRALPGTMVSHAFPVERSLSNHAWFRRGVLGQNGWQLS